MIANSKELKIALRSLRISEESLTALESQLIAANPDLLTAAAPTYTQHITALQGEIANYFYAHPAAVSQLVTSASTKALVA